MPELPEVETIVRELREADLIGVKIKKAHVLWHRSIGSSLPDPFSKQIADQTILAISRRGKNIVFKLSKDTLIVHLRMTGKFTIAKSDKYPPLKHERVQLLLDDGRLLRFEDQRKFGKWYLSNHPEEMLNKLAWSRSRKTFLCIALKN